MVPPPSPKLVAARGVEALGDIEQKGGHRTGMVAASLVLVTLLLQQEPPHCFLPTLALSRVVVFSRVARHPVFDPVSYTHLTLPTKA